MANIGTIEKVGIVGSGIMASGLVEVAAKAGHDVIVRSRTQSGAEALVAGLACSLGRQVDRGKLADDERLATLRRVTATAELDELRHCDLVIESIVESMPAKRELFGELDRVLRPGALLATNTSTLPVVELAVATSRPESVCGIHFFNPAPAMKLVEIVKPLTAAPETIDAAAAFVERCGKDAVMVADHAGFIVNALLFPYLNNAVRLWERGTASMEDIDTAMRGGCNFPMGPFALLDLVGLDTALSILETLHAEQGDASFSPAVTLRRLVAAGRLGRKSGHGFYPYG